MVYSYWKTTEFKIDELPRLFLAGLWRIDPQSTTCRVHDSSRRCSSKHPIIVRSEKLTESAWILASQIPNGWFHAHSPLRINISIMSDRCSIAYLSTPRLPPLAAAYPATVMPGAFSSRHSSLTGSPLPRHAGWARCCCLLNVVLYSSSLEPWMNDWLVLSLPAPPCGINRASTRSTPYSLTRSHSHSHHHPGNRSGRNHTV